MYSVSPRCITVQHTVSLYNSALFFMLERQGIGENLGFQFSPLDVMLAMMSTSASLSIRPPISLKKTSAVLNAQNDWRTERTSKSSDWLNNSILRSDSFHCLLSPGLWQRQVSWHLFQWCLSGSWDRFCILSYK